jgi:hypothetical protein
MNNFYARSVFFVENAERSLRFSLLDLLLSGLISTLGLLLGVFLTRFAGVERFELFFGWLMALLAYLLMTPPIYRKLHFRPMQFPRCPHCKNMARHYWFEKPLPDWPRDVIICAICKAPLELWYEVPEAAKVSETMSSYQLVWPQSWGRWRAIIHRDVE